MDCPDSLLRSRLSFFALLFAEGASAADVWFKVLSKFWVWRLVHNVDNRQQWCLGSGFRRAKGYVQLKPWDCAFLVGALPLPILSS